MSRTKAQLERELKGMRIAASASNRIMDEQAVELSALQPVKAQLTVAQSLVRSHQETIRTQYDKIKELEQSDRSEVYGLRQDCIALTKAAEEYRRRLIRRAGKVEALQDLVLSAMDRRRPVPREVDE